MSRARFFAALLAMTVLLTAPAGRATLVLHLSLDEDSDSIPASKALFVRGVVGDAVAIKPGCEGLVVESDVSGLSRSKAVSIGCWFKSERPPDTEFAIVEAGGCRLAVAERSGSASFSIRGVRGRLAGIAAANRVNACSNVCDGQWHHIVGLYDGQTMSLFVDGVMEEVIDASGPIGANTPRVTLGTPLRTSVRSANSMSCCIDDLRIHDEALDYDAITRWMDRKVRRIKAASGRRVDLHRDFLSKGVFPIQAHRGGGVALPENTLETYRATWGMEMIPEADIRTTKDGVIICMHDSDLRRLSPATPAPWNTVPFEEMTLQRIKTFDVGAFRGRSGQKVPTLEEVFRDMQDHPERMLEIDYKRIELSQLAGLIKKCGLQDQVIFVTRFQHLIRQWQRVSPRAMTMLWMGGSEQTLDRIFEQLRRDEFAGISILQIILFRAASAEGFRPSIGYLKQRQLELAEKGIALQLIPWGIPDKAVFERLLSAGFRFFSTDYPEPALEAYKRLVQQEIRD